MNTLSINFNSINATRNDRATGKVNVSSNIGIDSVEDASIGVDKKNKTMKINFTFTTKYSGDFAEIVLKGTMIVLEESKKAKTIIDGWAKNKKLNKDFATTILNILMTKGSMETVLLAKELNLPSPIQLPTVRAAEPKSAPKKTKK